MEQVQTTALLPARGTLAQMDVRFVAGESYEVAVRGHRVLVDQPAEAGGAGCCADPDGTVRRLAGHVRRFLRGPVPHPARLQP